MEARQGALLALFEAAHDAADDQPSVAEREGWVPAKALGRRDAGASDGRSRFGGVEHHHLILVDTERNDTKILEVVVELDKAEGLFVGQRVVGYVTKAGHMTKGH